jgi:hypothetical protein
MKKLCFVLIGFSLMLCLGWGATANAAECQLLTLGGCGSALLFELDDKDESGDATVGDDVILTFNFLGEWLDVWHINLEGPMYDQEGDEPLTFTLTQVELDATGFHIEVEPYWTVHSWDFDDYPHIGTVLKDFIDYGGIGDVTCGAASPFIIDPNVMLVYETGESVGDFGLSLVTELLTGEVTVTLDPNTPGEGNASADINFRGPTVQGKATRVFTAANWDIPQSVSFEAIDDDVIDGPALLEEQVILITSEYPTDPENGDFVGSRLLRVNVMDNEQPNILFTVTPVDSESPKTPVRGKTVRLREEEPGWRKIGVTLQVEPTGGPVELEVVVESEGLPPSLLNLPLIDPPLTVLSDPNTLIFTAGDYNVSQDIQIWANDDDVLQVLQRGGEYPSSEGEQNYQATLTATVIKDGGDEGYADMEQSVDFDIEDNECGAYGTLSLDIGNSDPCEVDDDGNPLPDCYVDLYDAIEMATRWLGCTDPQGDGCEQYNL